jgi:RimJ/RimL family protein N-acetyltransferase
MTKLKIYENGNLQIVYNTTYSQTDIELLKKTIYGTNGPRYQHFGQSEKICDLKKPHFFQLFLDEKLIGFYCICERDFEKKNEKYIGFYGRYLTIDTNFQGKKYGQLIKLEAVKYLESQQSVPAVFYSYIEENNARSLKISENEGFIYSTHLKTTIFTRLFPKITPGFEQVKQEEMPQIKSLLNEKFNEYSFKTFENIGYKNNYFVLKRNGEIVAGLQANPVQWKIHSMEGIGGIAIMHILPKIPILKRLINPNKYEFLAIEGFYFKENPADLYPLLESVLAFFKKSSALFQLDFKDPLLDFFTKNGNLGILNAMKKDTKTHVMVKVVGFDWQQSQLAESTAYVSSFDFT